MARCLQFTKCMETLEESLSRIIAFLPDLLAGLMILAIGWLIAAVIRRVIVAVLPRLAFDRFIARHGLSRRPVEERWASRGVGALAFWAIFLIALMQATQVWDLPLLSNGIASVLAFIPNAVIAVVVFAVALVAGNWVWRRLREAPTQHGQPQSELLPGAVRAGILTIGAFIALRELNVASEILVIAFTLVFGAIAIAMALAFGLGGRRTAEKVTDDWYEGQRARMARTAPSRTVVPPDVH